MLVLDASVAMAWRSEDEHWPDLDELMMLAQDAGFWVPSLWHLELGNALKVAVRRKRIAREALEATIALFTLAHVHVDEETYRRAWGPTLALADQHGLTLYDAAYLELALRRRLPLASLDADLRAAAAAQGVISLPA